MRSGTTPGDSVNRYWGERLVRVNTGLAEHLRVVDRRFRGWIVLPTLLSLVLSWRAVNVLPLSHDEFYTLHAITEGLVGHLWEAPLLPYYSLEWAATFGGRLTSDLGMRWLSMAAIAATVACVAAAAALLGSRKHAYTAGLLMAISGVALVRAVEARPYAVGLGLFSVAVWLLIKMSRVPTRAVAITYSLVLLAGLIVMPQGVVVLVAHGLWIMWRKHPSALTRCWLVAVAPTVTVAAVGGVLALLNVFPNMHNWLGAPSLTQVPEGILWSAGAGNAGVAAEAAVGLSLMLLGLAAVEVRALVVGVLLASLFLFLGSQGGTSFWTSGSFVSLVPIVVLAGGFAIGGLSRASWLAILLVLVLVSLPVYTAARLPRTGEADMRLAVALVEAHQNGPTSLFGDPTDAYGLWPAMKHYGVDSAQYSPTRSPTQPYWAVYDAPDCVPTGTWEVGGGATLKLCRAPAR